MVDFSAYRETKEHRRLRYLIFTFLLVPLLSGFLTAIAFAVAFVMGANVPTLAFAALFFGLWIGIYRFMIRGIGNRFIMWLRKKLDEGRFSSGGRARFISMFEEPADVARTKYSIYVGRSLFSRLWEHNWYARTHLTTFAGSQSGKGAGQIIPNLLRFEGSAIVIDPKGTNTCVTAAQRRRMGQNVAILDPLSEDPIGNDTWNPLDNIDINSLTAVDEIYAIAEAIIPMTKDGRSEHFSLGSICGDLQS